MVTCCALGEQKAAAQLPFFPGAEGYGGSFSGTAPSGGWFSNADVYHVTTTQDLLLNGKGAPGTLRGAFVDHSNPSSPKQKITNRIVVFDVGGTFELTQGKLDIKEVNNIYIAGQTAPSPVTVYGNTSQITKSNNTMTSNVILRYMSFRKGTGDGSDSITFAGGDGPGDTVATNMIIDHVSASWSEDEVLSVANNNTNITVQYTMMTDSLTSGHQYGSLMRPKVDSQVTFHHNLYGNDKSRNPRMGSYNNATLTLDFVDNVIYNWSERAGYAGGGSDSGSPTEKVNVNWVGNYAIAGPATPAGAASTTAVTKDIAGSNPLEFKVYQALNLIDSNHNAVRDAMEAGTGWSMFRVSNGSPLPEADKAASPFATPPVTTTGAADAYKQVISYVGNWWWDRDVIDQRIIGNVQNNTQPAGGIPALAPVPSELAYVTSAAYPAAPTTHPAGWDTDGDGMPNWWEVAHGLNSNSAADGKLDFDNDGYINLIEYLNEAGEFPAPAPIVFNGATNNRYALITNWKTSDGITAGSNWQPSKYDEAQINGGTVMVESVGQHAGLLIIGANAGNNATLNITNGWLQVADAVVIGGDDAATATLNLSGGTLSAPVLAKGAGGTFNFTGGVLQASVVGFNLHNQGGTFAPGQSVGPSHVMGDLTLAGGSLQIELASTSSSDTLLVDGDVALGGNLSIVPMAGFTPTIGNSWQIIAAGNIDGEFAAITSGYSVQMQGNNLMLYFGTAPPIELQGDFNGDGVVDAADYVVARKSGDADDYLTWRANFGTVQQGTSGSADSLEIGDVVPEPAACVLLVWGASCLASIRRRCA